MTKKISLSERLQTIADMVTDGARLADVGTDHGHLPIALLQSGRIPHAIAMDIQSGPLEQARANRDSACLSDRMELRLSDGLSALRENEADTIVASGMGGILIRDILERGASLVAAAEELILSPQSDIPLLRRYLRTHGFEIADETVVCDGGKYYTVIKAVPSVRDMQMEQAETIEDRYGPVLLKKRQKPFLSMLQKQAETNEHIICRLEQAKKSPENAARIRMLKQRQAELLRILQTDKKE